MVPGSQAVALPGSETRGALFALTYKVLVILTHGLKLGRQML